MGIVAERNGKKPIYLVFCILAGAVALFPVSCNYMMGGGMQAEWVARVTELGEGLGSGLFLLFPRMETLAGTGILANGMNSNLWFLLPGLLYLLSGSVVLAYRFFMVTIQGGTFLASMLLFRRLFPGETGKVPAFYGMLLYMTCPYRIYACYDLANLSQAAVWMLLPLYLWAVLGAIGVRAGRHHSRDMQQGEDLHQGRDVQQDEDVHSGSSLQQGGGLRQGRDLLLAGLILAGIGYADAALFVIVLGLTLLMSLFLRKAEMVLVAVVGGFIFAPGLYRLVQYLLLGAFREMGGIEQSIERYGYRLGFYLDTYAFRDGHPGMGLGMMGCLLAGIWLRFVDGKREKERVSQAFLGLGIFLVCLSFYRFPWDYVQRLGSWALRLVSLISSPGVFWGMAQLCLCVPAARAVNRIRQYEDKWVAEMVPVLILLASVAVCVYQCNMLAYNRMPLL